MIATRNWLNEFVDISSLSNDELARLFVSIGHEIASVSQVKFDDLVVAGKVLKREKHPNAEKLSVCEVDVGGAKLQIVCGAKNVEADQIVPVALIGAKVGGITIREAELRGVKSFGMICSAKELGLPQINDGILPLDSSIGDLAIGRKLNDLALLADTIFEVELTANRGDCLSIYGLARELSAALKKPLKEISPDLTALGIAPEKLAFPAGNCRRAAFAACDFTPSDTPLLIKLRLGWAGLDAQKAAENYAAHATGVVVKVYDYDKIHDKMGDLANGAGFVKDEDFAPAIQTRTIAIAALFAPPEEISRAIYETKTPQNPTLNRLAKGAEPQVNRAINFLAAAFGLKFTRVFTYESQIAPKVIETSAAEISNLIGIEIAEASIVEIFTRLSIKVENRAGKLAVTIPDFRHDIANFADLTEEITRIIGIDAIAAKPLKTAVKRAATEGWRKFRFERDLAFRAAAAGFNESMHFVFCDSAIAAEFGFAPMKKELCVANPIAANLDALRPTLLVNLLQAAQLNRAKNKAKIALFEIGDVYDAAREQSREMAFVFAGDRDAPSAQNHGKSRQIDFFEFAKVVSKAIGNFELSEASAPFLQAGQSAAIVIGGENIGVFGKIAPSLAAKFDLPSATFAAAIALDKLSRKTINALPFSKFQPLERDLSIVIAKSARFSAIKKAIESLAIADIKKVLAVDIYEGAALGENHSFTIRLVLQPMEKSLAENEIAEITAKVLAKLEADFGAKLR
ncbi:MAG: phenylalanine--tRNA ligase subunit beta [Helicobacteraceae bacterium]|jgi:phenylalanyl-tRNA synthetase beta chain|nr:phenylalanine--tRNA ligase subunit beta [Helicobacteraceae bacterium]